MGEEEGYMVGVAALKSEDSHIFSSHQMREVRLIIYRLFKS